MPYSDPDKNRAAKRNFARTKQGYKRGTRLQEFLQEFTNLEFVLSDLDPDQRTVIELYYGLVDGVPQSLQQIGDQLGCTRQNVGLLKGKALQEVRKKLFQNT